MILRASSYRRTQWKNGGGETMEIAVWPAGSTLDTFDWRISMATVASDGPFSIFAGVARTLCILDGAGIEVHLGDEPARHLTVASEPWSFSGEAVAHARLIGGAVTDFNVMTRRARFRHRVRRITLHSSERLVVDPAVQAIFCQSGVITIQTLTAEDRLGPWDTMLRPAGTTSPRMLLAEAAATACLVTLSG